MTSRTPFGNLLLRALDRSADDAVIISTESILVEEKLAEMCRTPGCDNYGRSINCPPHTLPLGEFRTLLASYTWALLSKMDIAPEVLLSNKRLEAFKRLQEVTARIESLSIASGNLRSRGFAGGSCEQIFCRSGGCRVLTHGLSCPYPDSARPSLSAFGVNVFKLARHAGWEMHRMGKNSDPDSVPSSLLIGLVLLA